MKGVTLFMKTDSSNTVQESMGLYLILPVSILEDERIPLKAAILYGYLTVYATKTGYCFASNAVLANRLQCEENCVQKNLAILEKAGYILRKEIRDEDGRTSERHIYVNVRFGADPVFQDIREQDKPQKKKAEVQRHAHGSNKNVLLTDEEFEKLKIIFGAKLDEAIEDMSVYCAAHGKSYKSFYNALLNWQRMQKKRDAAKPKSRWDND